MSAARSRLANAISELKRVDQEARMTQDTASALGALAPSEPWLHGSTDTTLLQAALEQAGRVNAVQAEMIEEQRQALALAAEDLVSARNTLADWQRRYQSVADRLSENWPTDPQVAKLRAWLTELQGLLSATLAEASESRAEAKGWREKYYGSFDPGARQYAEGPVAPAAAAPAATTDDEMLG